MTHTTTEAVYEDAARHIGVTLTAAIERRGRATLVLTGGSTIPPVYERLASGAVPTPVAWDRVDCFWSDERCVGPEDPRSNYGAAKRTLLDPLGVPATRVHRMNGEAPDPERAALDYEAEIAGVLGDGSPRFDLLLLGVGADAHIASLFPGHPLIDTTDRFVGVVHADRFDVPEPSIDRLTLTPPAIRAARETFLVVTGARKACAVKAALQKQRDARRWPAQIADGPDSKTTWLLDQDAAGALEG